MRFLVAFDATGWVDRMADSYLSEDDRDYWRYHNMLSKLTSKYVRSGYITIEFDTETSDARLVPM